VDGRESNELVLMLLGEAYGSARYGSAVTAEEAISMGNQEQGEIVDGTVPFVLIANGGPDGGPCFQAGTITDHGISQIRFIAPSAGVFTLNYKVSSEGAYDFLTGRTQFSEDDLFSISGTVDWSTETVHVVAGEALDVTYTKDGSVSQGEDTGWITVNFLADEGGIPSEIQGQAALLFSASAATLSHIEAVNPDAIPFSGRCGLALVSAAIRLISRKRLKVSTWLRFTTSHSSAKPPAGLQSQLRDEINPLQPDDPDEYLQVWFYGHPQQHTLTARIDDAPAFTPAFTWQNPGTMDPAIIKIPLAGLPGDGSTHVITISVSQRINGQTSPAATVKTQARLPLPKPPQPVSIHARLIRQATQEIPDLVEVTWTASSGVIISANLRPQDWGYGQDPTKLAGKTVKLGYGNADENALQLEGVGGYFDYETGAEHSVYFSVAEIRHNEIGPPLFTVNPIRIRAYKAETIAPKSPDERAGTAQQMGSQTLRYHLADGYSGLNATIAQYAYDKLLLRIKSIVAKGGSVTLDDLGRFETRWSDSKLTKGPAGTFYTKPAERSVTFVPSIGFKEGTERGRVMTDAEAKALQ
jgi:nucleoid DNA-binding protein